MTTLASGRRAGSSIEALGGYLSGEAADGCCPEHCLRAGGVVFQKTAIIFKYSPSYSKV